MQRSFLILLCFVLGLANCVSSAEPPVPNFEPQTVDNTVAIGYPHETGDPLGMLSDQRQGKGTAHGRSEQHGALDLELIEKGGKPTFRQLLARRRLSESATGWP